MGILTTTLIVGGVIAGIGLIGTIIHGCTEDERAQAEIDRLTKENEALYSAKTYLEDLIANLTTAITKLNDGKEIFQNGGYVIDGNALAHEKFTSCISKLQSAKYHANNIINDIEATIEYNDRTIIEEEAKLGK